jgi:polyphosphate kinase
MSKKSDKKLKDKALAKKKRTYKDLKLVSNPDLYINREISWLEFNSRVLNEAVDKRTPLLERLRFISIYNNNLDEFVMKRVGGLKRQIEASIGALSCDGRTALEQCSMIRHRILKDSELFYLSYENIVNDLAKEKIFLQDYEKLEKKQKDYLNEHFTHKVFPLLTPLLVDPGHPFPFISNLSYSLAVLIKHPSNGEEHFARLKIPTMVNFWEEVPTTDSSRVYVRVDQVVRANLNKLFHGMQIIAVAGFRVTRNADLDHDDDEAHDLLDAISEGLRERKFAESIRLEIEVNAHQKIKNFLMSALDLKEDDVYPTPSPVVFNRFGKILDLDLPLLKYSHWTPRHPKQLEDQQVSIFNLIKNQDILVHHPYDSFAHSVERFILSAAIDPNVLAIKMTLYRTGDHSPFIAALKKAAELGKQVVCLVELKARFDEERNIHWANELERAGVHVVYGLIGLKTHSKISLVIRKEDNGELISYCHIGTGNYHSQTSNFYTDFGLFTINKKLTEEIIEVFNYLTGISLKTDYEKILLAPLTMKARFVHLIGRETKLAREGKPARIIAKMNSLEDSTISEALYQASQAGVKIILYVRGFCCLRPSVKGLSDNIKVISVIGRFLEHSRIFYFSNGSSNPLEGDFFIGSADWMHRNLHKRVEVIAPIEDLSCREKIWQFLQVLENDKRQSWLMDKDGAYLQLAPKSKIEESSGTHETMMVLNIH